MAEASATSAASPKAGAAADIAEKKKRRLEKSLPGYDTPECTTALQSAREALMGSLDYTAITGRCQAEAEAMRRNAKSVVKEASKQIRSHKRKVKRLQKKAKGLSEEGLLLEYARRQAKKGLEKRR